MAPSLFARAAFAAGLLASTTSAKFDGNAKTNVAMYWGQGSYQIPLLEVCEDPNIDIVNIGFVNKFPKNVGEYPGTNHANACGDATYLDPTTRKPSALLSSCPGVGDAIKTCQSNGKKVMLSLGGGYPVDYYLPSDKVANWFAEFLIGAYGPLTAEWKAAGKPRPFGDAVVDGFDLDLEAADWAVPTADDLWKNYDVFGKYVKAHSNMLLSGAPQCVVPDARIFQALKEVPFDFLFTQFYNTWTCSAAKAVQDIKNKAESTFTFDTWVSWLKANSKNPAIKLYLGLAAGPDGLPTHKDHYLTPEDANTLVEKYKGESIFGGVMLWEATVSKNNQAYDRPYGAWMKYAVEGTFRDNYRPIVSSSVLPSSTPISSIHISSSVLPSSTPVSSSIHVTPSVAPSSYPASSAHVSSSVMPSSYPASSAQISSSVLPSSAQISSSVQPSSAPVSSIDVTPSPLPSSYPASSVEVSSSVMPSEYPASSSVAPSSTPEVYPSSSVATVSSTIESSSVATVSASEIVSSSSVVPSNSEISSSCTTSSGAYPTGANSSSDVYPVTTPEASSAMPYPSEKSSVEYPVYPTESSKGYGEYPVASSTGYDSVPSFTKKPEHSVYPTVPAGSTTSVVTTTYVDVCPTGLTTVTTTYVATVCTKCAKPTGTTDVPEGWTTSVYTASTVTVTITKPIATATGVSVYPSAVPSVAYPAEHPAVPSVAYPAEYPAAPSVAYPAEYPAAPSVAYPAEYPASPIASGKPAYPAVPEASKAAYPVAPEHPAYSAVPSAAYPVSSSPAVEYPSQPIGEYPKKPVEHEVTSTMHVTLSTVSIPAYTPAPYPSAGVPHVPAGPAKNATSVYVPMPTGTGKPTVPSAFVPSEFEGAASRAGVGFMMLVGAVGAVLVM